MLKFFTYYLGNSNIFKTYTQRVQTSQGREGRCLHSLYVVCVAPDEGATGPPCGWMEGITLPLLQRMETEEEKGRR